MAGAIGKQDFETWGTEVYPEDCSKMYIPGILFQMLQFDRSRVGHSNMHFTGTQYDLDTGHLQTTICFRGVEGCLMNYEGPSSCEDRGVCC